MRLFIKSFLVFIIPFIILIGVYIWCDPFKVIFKYDNYLSEAIMLNRGYVSTEVFLKNNREQNYNSFIFGSSRSIAYKCKEWEKYLGTNSHVYSYGNWNESMEGVLKKLQFIDAQGNKIKNVIVAIDDDYTFEKDNVTLSNDHYMISGKSAGQYQMMCFTNWFKNFKTVPICVDYNLFKTRRSYMTGFIGMKPGDVDPVTNDWYPNSEDQILGDSVAYYSRALKKFYKREEKESESGIQISVTDSLNLQKMNSIFKKHMTNIKIIINPLYNQIRFNRRDLKLLKSVFGESSVFDFSGINDITGNMYNYLDDADHFRNRTGEKILKSIYSGN